MIYGIGMLENGITWDFAQLVMQNEMVGMILKTLEGVPVDDEHLAVDVISEVGPGGEFVSHLHTFQNFRTLSKPDPKLFDRNNFDGWMAEGGTDIVERAYGVAIDMLENTKPADPLPEATKKELDQILADETADYAERRKFENKNK
jgi:trimethylamine:corrinoid methyltransferase-like protein